MLYLSNDVELNDDDELFIFIGTNLCCDLLILIEGEWFIKILQDTLELQLMLLLIEFIAFCSFR